MAAPKTKVINPWDLLDDDGFIPLEPPADRALALRVAQCIEYGGPLARGHSRETLIPCRRRPDGLACSGLLVVLKQKDDAILVFCPICTADEYLIYEWEETLWARGPLEPIDLDAVMRSQGLAPKPPPGPESGDEQLARVLTLLGSPMTPAEVRRIVATAPTPNKVAEAVLGSLSRPPLRASLERFLPVLMNLWNDMRAVVPPPTTPARAAPKIRPNEPCPCGSGKKYKRCCMHDQPIH